MHKICSEFLWPPGIMFLCCNSHISKKWPLCVTGWWCTAARHAVQLCSVHLNFLVHGATGLQVFTVFRAALIGVGCCERYGCASYG